jgi:hypothetical protein
VAELPGLVGPAQPDQGHDAAGVLEPFTVAGSHSSTSSVTAQARPIQGAGRPGHSVLSWREIVRHNPGMRSVLAVGLVAAVACGSASEPVSAPRHVTGLITSIGRGDDGVIDSFAVEQGGQTYDIRIDPARDYGFDLEHLSEHRAGRLPVRVTLQVRKGALYAVEILDA